MYSKDYYNENGFRKVNRENRENIIEDSKQAKEHGVTYGQYKAGIKKVEQDGTYKTAAQEYIKRKEPLEENRSSPMAHVKTR